MPWKNAAFILMIKKWKAKMSKDVFKREFTPNNRQERSFHLIKALSSHAVGSIKDKDYRYSVNPSFHDHSAWVLEYKILKLKIRDLLFTTIYFIYDFELLRKSLFYFIFGVTTKSDPPKILTKGVWGGGGGESDFCVENWHMVSILWREESFF